MRAAILAGGKGSRIAEYFPDLPKPMIPISGKPLLQYQIEMLVSQGLVDITLIIGYKAEVIRDYFGNGNQYGAQIDYIVETSPLGTGGGLTLLPQEDTLILFGDVFLDVNFSRLVCWHEDKEADITLFVHPNNHMHDSDIVIVDDNDCIRHWASKKDRNRGEMRNLTNAGVYVFSKRALSAGAAHKCDLEQDIIIPMLPKGKVYAYRSSEYVKDMGTPGRLKQVTHDLETGVTAARSLRNMQKAIFLDRDGTINESVGYVTNAEQLKLIEGTPEAIKIINESQYLAICITNQPVIARGDVSFEELNAIHARLDVLLAGYGAYLDDLFFCPHHPDSGFEGERKEYKIVCDCRKPSPGLLLKAAKKYHIDLSQSYMIGDSERDIRAGELAGCKTIRIDKMNDLLHVIKQIGLGE